MRSDMGWLYLLAGGVGLGALVMRRSRRTLAPGATVDLRGDGLALAIARPLRGLLAEERFSLDARRSRRGFSLMDPEIGTAPPSVIVLALGLPPASPETTATELALWASARASATCPVVIATPPSGAMAALGAALARTTLPHVTVFPLRPAAFDDRLGLPSMATAAVWATDLTAHLAP
jgi:hypothetical protein